MALKLSLGHCIAPMVVFIIGEVLFICRSCVLRHCCHGEGVKFMQMNLQLELSSNGKRNFYVQASFEKNLFEINRTVL